MATKPPTRYGWQIHISSTSGISRIILYTLHTDFVYDFLVFAVPFGDLELDLSLAQLVCVAINIPYNLSIFRGANLLFPLHHYLVASTVLNSDKKNPDWIPRFTWDWQFFFNNLCRNPFCLGHTFGSSSYLELAGRVWVTIDFQTDAYWAHLLTEMSLPFWRNTKLMYRSQQKIEQFVQDVKGWTCFMIFCFWLLVLHMLELHSHLFLLLQVKFQLGVCYDAPIKNLGYPQF